MQCLITKADQPFVSRFEDNDNPCVELLNKLSEIINVTEDQRTKYNIHMVTWSLSCWRTHDMRLRLNFLTLGSTFPEYNRASFMFHSRYSVILYVSSVQRTNHNASGRMFAAQCQKAWSQLQIIGPPDTILTHS